MCLYFMYEGRKADAMKFCDVLRFWLVVGPLAFHENFSQIYALLFGVV